MSNLGFHKDAELIYSEPALLIEFYNFIKNLRNEVYRRENKPAKAFNGINGYLFRDMLPILEELGLDNTYKQNTEIHMYASCGTNILRTILNAIRKNKSLDNCMYVSPLLAWASKFTGEDDSFYIQIQAYYEANRLNEVGRHIKFRPYSWPLKERKNRESGLFPPKSKEKFSCTILRFSDYKHPFFKRLEQSIRDMGQSVALRKIPSSSAANILRSVSNAKASSECVVLIYDELLHSILLNLANNKSSLVPVLEEEAVLLLRHNISFKKAHQTLGSKSLIGSITSKSNVEICCSSIMRFLYILRNQPSFISEYKEGIHKKETGRLFLEEKLQHRAFQNRKLGKAKVIVLDIDKTNQINKRFGEEVGNCVINEVLELIQRYTNHMKVDSGRCGDDTFYCIIYNQLKPIEISDRKKTELELLGTFMEGLNQFLASHNWNQIAQKLSVTCSIGYAIFRDDENTIDTVIRACEGLVEAQNNGGNISCSGPKYLPINMEAVAEHEKSTRVYFS